MYNKKFNQQPFLIILGHCEEQHLPLPVEPMIFSKFSSVITGPYDDIKYPTVSKVGSRVSIPAYSHELS